MHLQRVYGRGAATASQHSTIVRTVTARSLLDRLRRSLGGPPAAGMASTQGEGRWWDERTVAVVTGANKGIGFEITRLLAEAGLTVIMTSRSEDLGRAALQKLQEQEATAAAIAAGRLTWHALDITSATSITALADWLRKEHGGRLDVLVNNAGIAYKGSTFGPQEAQTTLATNFLGTKAVCEALLPLLPRPGGRIVNVSSTSGLLRGIPSTTLRSRLETPAGVDELVDLGNQFVEAVRAGRHTEEGWPNSMYSVSKALETAYTRQLASQLASDGVMVNACCPGYCATDMSSWRGTQSAAAGADTPVWLALLPPNEFCTGGFWRDRKQHPVV